MAPFDFAPLARRYAQDERKKTNGRQSLRNRTPQTPVRPERSCRSHRKKKPGSPKPPFVLSVAPRQRREVEGRHLNASRAPFHSPSLPLMPVFPTRQPMKSSPVPTHQGLLLLPTPALDPQFGLQGLRSGRKGTGIYQRYGFPGGGVSEYAVVVLLEAVLEVVCVAGVVGAITTAKDIDPETHGGGVAEACVLRLRAAGAALRSGRTVYGL